MVQVISGSFATSLHAVPLSHGSMSTSRHRRLTLGICVLAAVLVGITIASTGSAASIRRVLPIIVDVQPPHLLEPVVALPRTTLVLSAARAGDLLEVGRPWAAWRELEPFLESEHLTPGTAILAARAAAGWGGWREVRSLLAGRPWLDLAEGGDGWRLLAEANEKLERWGDAAAAYERFAALVSGRERGIARVRRASALLRLDDLEGAASALRAAGTDLDGIADWLAVRQLEVLARANRVDPGLVRVAVPMRSAVARSRWAIAASAALVAAGDSSAASATLEREMRLLIQQRALTEGTGLVLEWSRLVGEERRDEAREQLRALAWETSLPAALRARAADRLNELAGGSPSPAEELARAAAYEAVNRPGHAARALRAAIAAGVVDDPATRFRLGRLLFDAGDNRPAREVLVDVAPKLERELAAEAELLAARARFRAGDRAGGLADLRRVADNRPGTAASGTALFLLADAATRIEQAIPLYRRAASTDAPEARESLHRLGDRRLRLNDSRGAAEAWEEYVRRFPQGSETARIAHSAALLNTRIGRTDAARRMFAAAVAADPLSYYAVRAGERIGQDPLQPILDEPRPWVGLTTDLSDARQLLDRLDLLEEAGLHAEWREELDAGIRRFDDRPLALITVAEGLRDRIRVPEAVRLARRILERRDGTWDPRLLRVSFPLAFRDLIEPEADRYNVDAMLFAGLIRQESLFQPAVRSRVGATGLSQIMPATGRWIAPRVGLPAEHWAEGILAVPEVNLRMGALFLSDLMRRYDGATDLALAGYNAGPARADRWRRELRHDRDVDAFRDAIPFDETRHYVKIVLRNAWVYQRLYGEVSGAPRTTVATSSHPQTLVASPL